MAASQVSIRNLGSNQRWGEKIILLPTGTWFWDEVLQDISYVPSGRKQRVYSAPLHYTANHRKGAIRAALSAYRDHVMEHEEFEED